MHVFYTLAQSMKYLHLYSVESSPGNSGNFQWGTWSHRDLAEGRLPLLPSGLQMLPGDLTRDPCKMLGAKDTRAHKGSELHALEEETDFSQLLSRDSITL